MDAECPVVIMCLPGTVLRQLQWHQFIASTSLKVCYNLRRQHCVFADLGARGKTSVDWFFSFKLHLFVNDQDELLILTITMGNTDQRKLVPKLLQSFFGKVFAQGYVSQSLARQLLDTYSIEFSSNL